VSESAALPTPVDDHALAARRLRDHSFGQVILLVVQTVLGMRVNLFVQVPAGDQGKGLLSSFGNAMSKGPAEIAAHAGLGLLLFINACLLVVYALPVRGTSPKIASVLGWLTIIGAAVSGASFVNLYAVGKSSKAEAAVPTAAEAEGTSTTATETEQA
jgi:heme A synthase